MKGEIITTQNESQNKDLISDDVSKTIGILRAHVLNM